MTSGSRNPGEVPRLCQIGVALGTNNSFRSDIGWDKEDYTWEPEALAVNGFTLERIEAGPPANEVDDALYTWLTTNGIGPREGIPVGYAVASFDMPFVRDCLPRSANLFSMRCVDLTAVAFAMQEARRPYAGTPRDKKNWKDPKRTAKINAAEVMGNENWHDAEYDAISALLNFQWFTKEIGYAAFE